MEEWYSFRYLPTHDHTAFTFSGAPVGALHIGTMAQDLLRLGRDDAVCLDAHTGFYVVDYSLLDIEET